MWVIFAVAIGGAAGAVARYWVVQLALTSWGPGFPWGVMIVNVAGSFLLGLLGVLLIGKLAVGDELRLTILVGILGAFTTFSTFSLDTLYLLEQAQMIKAAANVARNMLLCLAAVWLGVVLARQM